MAELRQDPVSRDWVIVNPERAQRPHDTARTAAAQRCPFCRGNEDLLPTVLDSIVDHAGTWLVRAVPNKFPALAEGAPDSPPPRHAAGWHWRPGRGRHEVIIESPAHDWLLGPGETAQARRVLEMYLRRYRSLAAADRWTRQIVLFRNHGPHAGTSLRHPHSQIVATPVVSPEVRRRMADEVAFYDASGCCALCRVLDNELGSGIRIVHRSRHFVTFAPYAPRAAYHLQTVPRRHCAGFAQAQTAELDDLAAHLCAVCGALRAQLDDPDFNLVVVTPPLDQVHQQANHWFIDIVPRLSTPAGFELGAGIPIVSATPESAATALRARLAPADDPSTAA